MGIRAVTILGLAIACAGVATLAQEAPAVGASAEQLLDEAVHQTLDAPAVHIEQRTTAPRGVDKVEDFIAPDRLRQRSARQRENLPIDELPIFAIAIGETTWFRDSNEKMPADQQAFVQCRLGAAAATPEAFGFLELITDASDVRLVSNSRTRYRFVLHVDDPLFKRLFDKTPGTATVREGRVTRFAFTTPNETGPRYRVTYVLEYDDVPAIEPPPPAQVISTDCMFSDDEDGPTITFEPPAPS